MLHPFGEWISGWFTLGILEGVKKCKWKLQKGSDNIWPWRWWKMEILWVLSLHVKSSGSTYNLSRSPWSPL